MSRAWTDEERRARSVKFATDPLCPSCGETDPAMFYAHKKNGRRSNAYCSTCHKKRCRDRYQNKSMEERRERRAAKYGISQVEYEDLVRSSGGKCAVCGEVPSTARGLHLDHDHVTGKVRGLLCHGCNVGIGSLKEDISVLKKAVEYLERHTNG